ncbi:MAG: substrate-binding domain-containing protein [Anaerolineae bacterium]|nr:substrate-binding domain-containing protein [Anaerolineae bacterium]
MRYLRQWLLLTIVLFIIITPLAAYAQDDATGTPEPTPTQEGEAPPEAPAEGEGPEDEGPVPTAVPGEGPTPVPFDIAAEVRVNGAASGYEISQAVARLFNADYPNVEITVGVSGTAGGFDRFCNGETYFNHAARPIFESEATRCEENGVAWIELLLGYEGVVVAAHPEVAAFAACVTTGQLATAWSRAAEPTAAVEPTVTPEGYEAPEDEEPLALPTANPGVTNWNQVDASFPDLPLLLFGDRTNAAVTDLFTEFATGTQGDLRTDYIQNSRYQALVDEMVGKPGAMGFFGFNYFSLNEEELTLLEIDAGDGCVAPSAETIADGSYPLARPIYLYVAAEQVDNPAVRAFVDFYFSEEGLAQVSESGYFPASEEVYAQDRDAIVNKVTGRAFTEAPPEPEPVVTPTPTPEASEETPPAEGEESGAAPDLDAAAVAFAESCASCHGEGGQGGTVGPDLYASEDVRAMSADEIHDLIANGIDGTAMPGFGDTLAAEVIDNLVALLQSWQEGDDTAQ